MHESLRTFLRAACASPTDDLPRLVLTDWLKDNGYEDWASLMRSQLGVAVAAPIKRPNLLWCELLGLEPADDDTCLRGVGRCEHGEVNWSYHRGLPHQFIAPRAWLGASPCPLDGLVPESPGLILRSYESEWMDGPGRMEAVSRLVG